MRTNRRASNTCKLSVREVYKAISRIDEKFGFFLGKDKSFKDSCNEEITDRLVNAVIAGEGGIQKCSWSLREIQGAAKTYYISLRDQARRKENGKDRDHSTRSRRQSRRRERAARLKITIKGLKDDALQGLKREKVMKVLTPDYLSSEESDINEEGEFQHFNVRRLPWQNERFRELKDKLEEVHKARLSPQHQRQLKARRVSMVPSKRKAPEDCPKFVRREEENI